MPFQSFDLETHGMLVRNQTRAVPPHYVREALNLIAVHGRWRSRPGIRPFTGAAQSGVVRGAHFHYRPDGSRDVLVAAGAAMQRDPAFGDPIDLSLAALPTTEQTRVDPVDGVRFLSISGTNFVTIIYDGVNPNLKWTGTTLTRVGIKPPTAPSAPSSTTGSVNPGQRMYVRTLRTAYHESEPSDPFTFTQVGTGGQIFATPSNGVDYDDPQVSEWALYTTTAGGAREFFVGKADIGSTITHNVSDDQLGPTALEQLVNDSPDGKFVTMVEHKGLVFAVMDTDRNLVRFCHGTEDYVAPEGWPISNAIPVAHGDGDEIQIAISFFEYLLIFKKRGTFAITGDTDAGFTVTPVLAAGGALRTGIGAIAAEAVMQLENEVLFPSRDGFYVVQRSQGFSGGVEALKVSDAIDGIYRCTDFSRGAAALFDRRRKAYFFFGHGGGG